MSQRIYNEILALSGREQYQERSLQYLPQHLEGVLRQGERVLICFHEHKEGNLSWLMQQAVLRCGAVPLVGQDRRWKTLLRTAFLNKASVIIGEPLIILGLTKLMKNCNTPLYIRRVITSGYPCPRWMIDGIVKGFDCVVGGCYALGITGAVAGFACGKSWGVHLRQEEYGVDIVDEDGNVLPDGELGEMVIYPRSSPELRLPMGERARKITEPCKCGCEAPRLVDFVLGLKGLEQLIALEEELQSWTSILDCKLVRGECGLEIDIVAFPGERLPKLPMAARLAIRNLNLDEDEPFWYDPSLTNPALRY